MLKTSAGAAPAMAATSSGTDGAGVGVSVGVGTGVGSAVGAGVGVGAAARHPNLLQKHPKGSGVSLGKQRSVGSVRGSDRKKPGGSCVVGNCRLPRACAKATTEAFILGVVVLILAHAVGATPSMVTKEMFASINEVAGSLLVIAIRNSFGELN